MADVKLTKNELRTQQTKLNQLRKYLPTLQLKKAMLQAEVHEARLEIEAFQERYQQKKRLIETWAELLSAGIPLDPCSVAKVKEIKRRFENIAGVEVPSYEGVSFEDITYSLFETPIWIDRAIMGLRSLAETKAQVKVLEEKRTALEKELREVSIRVNLFEKILIPRALENIKTIKVFLGDQQLAAVSQAKVAKNKIEAQKIVR